MDGDRTHRHERTRRSLFTDIAKPALGIAAVGLLAGCIGVEVPGGAGGGGDRIPSAT